MYALYEIFKEDKGLFFNNDLGTCPIVVCIVTNLLTYTGSFLQQCYNNYLKKTEIS